MKPFKKKPRIIFLYFSFCLYVSFFVFFFSSSTKLLSSANLKSAKKKKKHGETNVFSHVSTVKLISSANFFRKIPKIPFLKQFSCCQINNNNNKNKIKCKKKKHTRTRIVLHFFLFFYRLFMSSFLTQIITSNADTLTLKSIKQ